tara:strand:+ start:1030 stop:1863 length:834 start_codon:yes stop_codon:yes gene_type:complete
VSDEKWILEPPSSRYLDSNAGKKSTELEEVLEDNTQQIIEQDVAGNEFGSDSYLATSSSVKLFLKDLKESGGVQSNPLAWAIAILVVAPAIIIGLKGIENGEEFSNHIGLSNDLLVSGAIVLFDFIVIGQLVLGPGACVAFARRKLLGVSVFVAMGSSAVLMISNQVVRDLAEANGLLAVGACSLCLTPMVMVLRNKRKQLPAGRARHTWALLMSTSIVMFASATLVVALQNIESPKIDDALAWSSLLLVAGAIGWAWPKGAELIEDLAEELVENAT